MTEYDMIKQMRVFSSPKRIPSEAEVLHVEPGSTGDKLTVWYRTPES